MKKLPSIFLIASGLMPLTILAQNSAETDMLDVMRTNRVVGMSVAVVKGGELTYVHSFGLKSIEKNLPVTDSTLFRIASISKSFSATTIIN